MHPARSASNTITVTSGTFNPARKTGYCRQPFARGLNKEYIVNINVGAMKTSPVVNNVQSMTYFRQTYGVAGSITMFHRMRTWYNHKAKVATKDRDTAAFKRYTLLASIFTAYIKAARNAWG